MKKYLILASICLLALTGCTAKETENYVVPGYYYDTCTVVTNDGNIWGYESEMSNGNVHVVFNDNGTADKIYDDIIIDLIKAK